MSELRGRTTPPDLFAGMNGTEKEFAIQLEAKRRDGQIAAWYFEAMTLLLGPDCRYTPDFMVIENDGTIGFDETKGHWRDDAKVKIRVAAKQYPFRFTAHVKRAKKLGGGWQSTQFSPHRPSEGPEN